MLFLKKTVIAQHVWTFGSLSRRQCPAFGGPQKLQGARARNRVARLRPRSRAEPCDAEHGDAKRIHLHQLPCRRHRRYDDHERAEFYRFDYTVFPLHVVSSPSMRIEYILDVIPIGLFTITTRPEVKQSLCIDSYPRTVLYASKPLSISVDMNLFAASCVRFIVMKRSESNVKIFSNRLTVYAAVERRSCTFVAPITHVLFARTEMCGG